ncbi:hypothetical protein RM572_00340 [Streptomyces sp. DSM 42041]|uniref:Phage tail protein n=1 Tax=Streptomyces hazeniae TaxID=3075538 RepID=A0ABU2NKG3_9ACTN|nr:hypothetical protein [Streptomyces sp. DSM 42041]MDT0377224.1 hypothetical protein [Streptomyces sp. DSM 42041]
MAEDVRIVVNAVDSTSGAFQSVNRNLQQLRGQAANTSTQVGGLNTQMQDLAGVTRDANGRIRDARGRFVSLGGAAQNLAGAASGAAGALGRAGGSSGPGLAVAIGAAAAAGMSALPALGAFVPMLAGVGLAAGTLGLAFNGVGDALEHAGNDSEKFQEALDKMGPAQRAFTEKLAAAKKEFKEFGKEIQRILLPKLTEAMKAAAPAMDTLQGGMKEMARTLGEVGKEFGEWLGSDRFRSALEKNLSLGTRFVEDFTRSLMPFTQSLLDFGAASKPTLDALGGGFADLLSQGLPGFFKELQAGIGGAAAFFRGLFSMINKLLPAFGSLSATVADVLGPVFEKLFNMWGNQGVTVMGVLEGALRVLQPVIKDLSYVVQIANQMFGIFAPLIRDVASAILNSLIPAGAGVDDIRGPFQRLSETIERNKIHIMEFARQFGVFVIDMVALALDNLPGLIGMFRLMATGILAALDVIVSGAAAAFGWIPGIGDKLEQANADFDSFKGSFLAGLQTAEDKARQFSAVVKPRLERNKLKMNIASWNRQIDEAKKKLKSVPKSKRADLRATISQLQRRVRQAKGELASIRDKRVNITSIFTRIYRTHYRYDGLPGLGGGWAHGGVVGGRAQGGVIGRAQTGGPRNGLTWVGEMGPELVSLPAGSTVRTAGDSQRMMRDMLRDGGGRGGTAVLEIRSGGSRMDDLLLELLRRAIRVRGGNVQVVLGGG